jgi:hypothetical protein
LKFLSYESKAQRKKIINLGNVLELDWLVIVVFGLVRKSAIFFDESFMDFIILTEEDDFIKLLIELIACDVLDNSRECFILGQILEVNGIVGCEIFVFWFYT